MISIKRLQYSYNTDTSIAFPDWQLEENQHSLILGNSGCGKTTLLHLLGGLLRSDNGEITIGSTVLNKLSNTELDHFRGKNIGFIFQKPHVIHALNVEDNLFLAQYLGGIKRDSARVEKVLKQLNIIDKRKSKVYELSEGQAQRVVIARAVINRPTLILADEPTSSLDDENCEKVIRILEDQAQESKSTLVIATHDQRLKDMISKKLNLS